MQNHAKSTSRGESGEIKNEYSLKKMLHMSWVSSPAKKKQQKNNNKQAKICAGDQTSEEGAEGEEGEWASARVYGYPKWFAERDSSASSSLGRSKLKSRPG